MNNNINLIDKNTPNILVLGDANNQNLIKRILTGQALSYQLYQCGKNFELLKNSYINFYINTNYKKEEKLIYEKELFNDILVKNKITIIWYCINAKNKKVEDFDIKIIKKLQKLKYTVCIILTNVNKVSKPEYTNLFSKIKLEIPFTNIYNYSENNGNKDYSKFIEWSFNIHSSKYEELFKENENINKIIAVKIVLATCIIIGTIFIIHSCMKN